MDRTTAVEKAFTKAIDRYDDHADLQREVADKLYRKFSPFPNGDWLEIGCGTGFLTQKLLNAIPQKLFANDLSQKMLEALPNDPRLVRVPGNAETMELGNNYSLIASSFAIQWFENPEKGLPHLADKLKKGGKMVVSLPLAPSFKEWEMFVLERKIPFTLNPLIAPEDLLKSLEAKGYRTHLSLEYYPLFFSSPWAFLSWFKGVGANVSLRKERMPISFLRELTNNKGPFNTGITVGFLEVEYV
jgi:malonyl-CoA O-methyltransferase